MKNNITENLIEFILTNYSEEYNTLFYGEFIVLKKYAYLYEVNDLYLKKLIELSKVIKDDLTKAVLIETIVEFDNFEFDNNELLLDEYIDIVSKNNINTEDLHNCINAFINSGTDQIKVLEKVSKVLNKTKALEVLMGIDLQCSILPENLKDIRIKSSIEKRRNYRIGIVSTFILITNTLCSKYDNNFCVSSSYPSYITAVEDYAWTNYESTTYIIKEKIITEEEATVLIKLGQLLKQNNSISESDAEKLYYDFFKDKDPYNVMFTLP